MGSENRKVVSYLWATCVTSDEFARDALVLWASLQRVGTKYPFMAYVGRNVSPLERSKLKENLDWIEQLPTTSLHLSANNLAKMECWNSKAATSICLLWPSTIITKNFDEIFTQQFKEGFVGAVEVGTSSCPTLLVNVDLNTYDWLVDEVEGIGPERGDSKLDDLLKDKLLPLPAAYNSAHFGCLAGMILIPSILQGVSNNCSSTEEKQLAPLQKKAADLRASLENELLPTGLFVMKRKQNGVAIIGMCVESEGMRSLGNTTDAIFGIENQPDENPSRLLRMVWNVLEDGGIVPNQENQSLGLFLSSSSNISTKSVHKILRLKTQLVEPELSLDFSSTLTKAFDAIQSGKFDAVIVGQFDTSTNSPNGLFLLQGFHSAQQIGNRIYATLTKPENFPKLLPELQTSAEMFRKITNLWQAPKEAQDGNLREDDCYRLLDCDLCLHIMPANTPQPECGFNSKTCILALSAKTEIALDQLVSEYADILDSGADPRQVCYSAAIGRKHFSEFRVFAVGKTGAELSTQLRSRISLKGSSANGKRSNVCFVFPGIGAPFFGMGRGLYETCTEFRRHFNVVASLVENLYGLSIRPIFSDTPPAGTSDAEKDLFLSIAQFAIEYALTKVLALWGIKPDTILPHSYGEYMATHAAGATTLPEMLYCQLGLRLRFGHLSPTGGMLALFTNEFKTNQLIDEFQKDKDTDTTWVQVSVINSNEQTVVSGSVSGISEFTAFCLSQNLKVVKLPVQVPAHSRGFNEMSERVKYIVQSSGMHRTVWDVNPDIQLISSASGQLTKKVDATIYFADIMNRSVNFLEACKTAYNKAGGRLYIEVGPPSLSKFVNLNLNGHVACVPCMTRKTKEDDWTVLLNVAGQLYINGCDLNWVNFYQGQQILQKCSLPLYPFGCEGNKKIPAVLQSPLQIGESRKKEVWITYAVDEHTANEALALLHSIRGTFSNRKTIVLIDQSLSMTISKKLLSEFDEFIWFSPNFYKRCNTWIAAFVHVCSLVYLDTVVLLQPSCVMLEHSDAIWDQESPAIGNRGAVVVVKPATSLYCKLLLHLESEGTAKMEDSILAILSYVEEQWGFLDNVYDPNELLSSLQISPKIVNGTFALTSPVQNIPTSMSDKCTGNEPIAIVGVSCRMPGARNIEEYWKLLLDGQCTVRPIPPGKWTQEQSGTIEPKVLQTQAGWLSCLADEFDGKFFNVSPMELSFMDPQQRLLLEVAYEAFEDAGISPQSVFGTNAAVYSGAWTAEYKDLKIGMDAMEGGDFYRVYMGNSLGNLSARIAHFFGLTGPSISTESGCSSSGVATGLAIKALRQKETNLAIACGVNLLNKPHAKDDFMGLLSSKSRCQVFDSDADGFVRAEGLGVLLLKRLSDAIKDGDNIHAVIKGFGMVQEGCSKSMGTPTVDGEATAMKLALQDAGIKPQDVQMIEAHGTGTAVGDPLELLAITKIYSSADRKEPLIITSGKANTGHCESAAAMAGILKTILQFKHRLIPPQIGITMLNPRINLTAIPAQIPLQVKSLHDLDQNQPLVGGISSFGITGTNTHLILQEAPKLLKNHTDNLKHQEINVLTLSAKSSEALEQLKNSYIKLLTSTADLHLDDVAYTANTGRTHFQHRISVCGSDCLQVAKKLKTAYTSSKETANSFCFLFTGQGSQWHKMGQKLYNTYPLFKENFDACEQTLFTLYNIELKDALWGGDETKLHGSLYSQASIFVMEYCLVQLWASWGIQPNSVLGHSLGEFAAATTAGILSMKDALKLLGARCRLIDSLPQGKMIAVNGNEETVSKLLKSFFSTKTESHGWLDIAAINSPNQTTLSGTSEAVTEFRLFCENNTVKSTILNATHAFHSRAMEPILKSYEEVALSLEYKPAKIPFISGVDGQQLENLDVNYWIRHTRNEVKFRDACTTALSFNKDSIYLELGPHPVLSAFIHANNTSSTAVQCYASMRRGNEIKTMMQTTCSLYMEGADIAWAEFHRHHLKSKTKLPFYPFQRKKHWFAVNEVEYGQKVLHPLLGKKMDLPSSVYLSAEINYFRNRISLKTHNYLDHHRVGKLALLPAAGFIEMALAAGANATGCKTFPLSVNGIKIKSALLIEDDGSQEVRTVSNKEGNVAVYHKQNGKWHTNAEAEVKLEQDFEITGKNCFAEIRAKAEIWEQEIPTLYQKLAVWGYCFGTMFQSLTNVKKERNQLFAEIVIPPLEALDKQDICHTIIIDGMIQAVLLSSDNKLDALYLPVQIQRFVALCRLPLLELGKLFVHVESAAATLYSQDGRALAYLSGLDLVKTNVKLLEKVLRTKGKDEFMLPPLYQEKWVSSNNSHIVDKPKPMPTMGEITFPSVDKGYGVWSEDFPQFVSYTRSGIILTFLRLGLDRYKSGEDFTVENFVKEVGILPELILPTRRLLEVVGEESYLHQSKKDFSLFTRTAKPFPKESQLEGKMAQVAELQKNIHPLELKLAEKFLKKLGICLRGEETVQSVIFSDTDPSISAEALYTNLWGAPAIQSVLENTFRTICSERYRGQDGVINILEIGAGTGSATKRLLPVLKEFGIKYTYTFTDLSAYFFIKAREMFKGEEENISYDILNIDEDPLHQGYQPNHYDLIVASNVLHATSYLSQTLQNVKILLKPQGLLLGVEILKENIMSDISFNLLPGFWQFKDFNLRPKCCTINRDQWKDLLRQEGFTFAKVFDMWCQQVGVILAEAATASVAPYICPKAEKARAWLLIGGDTALRRLVGKLIKNCGRRVIRADCNAPTFKEIRPMEEYHLQASSQQDVEDLITTLTNDVLIEGVIFFADISAPVQSTVEATYKIANSFLQIMKSMLKTHQKLRLCVVTRGQMVNDEKGMGHPAQSIFNGMYRSMQSEFPDMVGRLVDLAVEDDASNEELNAEIILQELWSKDPYKIISYRDGQRYQAQLFHTPPSVISVFPSLEIPSSRFHAIPPETKTITDLRFEASTQIPALEKDQIEVEVRSIGLNFRDVLRVLQPSKDFSTSKLGLDYSGVVVGVGPDVKTRKIGDRVIGANVYDDLPSHLVTEEKTTTLLSDKFTFAEGAALPVAYSTVHYALKVIASLKKGETILIHTASGAVGLAAIQVAEAIGAVILATAGRSAKREYVKAQGVQFVFSSRNLDFEQGVIQATGGRGVDVVLNTLTGPGFKEATLCCCAENARFVEISKMNIWGVEEVKKFRPDVVYSIIELLEDSGGCFTKLPEEMENFVMKKGSAFKALPVVQFALEDVRSALIYFQKAKHIGKVVLNMPSSKGMFHPDGTYLITGGCGGIGFEVCKWMCEQGASSVIIMGRNPPNEKTQKQIQAMNESGKCVTVYFGDIGDEDTCAKLFQHIKQRLPPLKGVMHCAGCLSDALFMSQSSETLNATYNAKVKGGWNLHWLTKDMQLEHFVMFSSIAVLLGSVGQANHSSANSFLDGLVNYRLSIGLPATTISWGQWGEVGIASELRTSMCEPFTKQEGINALALTLKTNTNFLAPVDLDIASCTNLSTWLAFYMENAGSAAGAKQEKLKMSSEEFWAQINDAKGHEGYYNVVLKLVSTCLAFILRTEEAIDKNQNLQDVGMDSLMRIEMKNLVQAALGQKVVLAISDLEDCVTLDQLGKKIVDVMLKQEAVKVK